MSGGHYDYMHVKQPDAFLRKVKHTKNLDMAVREFEEEGYKEISKEIQEAREELLDKWDEIEEIRGEIAPLLKAMSWWKSGDYGKDTFEKVVEEHNEEKRDE